MVTDGDEIYLTVHEVASRWRVSHMTVRRMIEKDKLRALRVGASEERVVLRIRQSDVEAYEAGS